MFNTLPLPQYIVTYHCFCQSLLYVRHSVLGAFAICSLPFAFSKHACDYSVSLLSLMPEHKTICQSILSQLDLVNPDLLQDLSQIVPCCSARSCGPITVNMHSWTMWSLWQRVIHQCQHHHLLSKVLLSYVVRLSLPSARATQFHSCSATIQPLKTGIKRQIALGKHCQSVNPMSCPNWILTE